MVGDDPDCDHGTFSIYSSHVPNGIGYGTDEIIQSRSLMEPQYIYSTLMLSTVSKRFTPVPHVSAANCPKLDDVRIFLYCNHVH